VAATLFMDGSEPDSTAKGELAQDRAELVGCAREGGFDGLASLVKVAPAFVVDGEDGSWPEQAAEVDGFAGRSWCSGPAR
jgi:hypothetical protein